MLPGKVQNTFDTNYVSGSGWICAGFYICNIQLTALYEALKLAVFNITPFVYIVYCKFNRIYFLPELILKAYFKDLGALNDQVESFQVHANLPGKYLSLMIIK